MVEGDRLDTVGEWVSLQEAARIAGLSEKTVRRRIHANQVDYRTEENGRYLIRTTSILPQPAEGRELVPMAVLEALEAVRIELQAEAVARAKAEVVAEFQTERAAEAERRRQQLEEERDRLAAEVERLRARRWWQR